MIAIPYSVWTSANVCFLITLLALNEALVSLSIRLKGLCRCLTGMMGAGGPPAAVELINPNFFVFSSSAIIC